MRLWPRMFLGLSIVCVKDVEIFKRDWKLHVFGSSILFLPCSLASGVKKLQPVTILLGHPLVLGWRSRRIVDKAPKHCFFHVLGASSIINMTLWVVTFPIEVSSVSVNALSEFNKSAHWDLLIVRVIMNGFGLFFLLLETKDGCS